MPLSSVLETLFKRLLFISALAMAIAYFYKDNLPPPDYYDLDHLEPPTQQPTAQIPFSTQVNNQVYNIAPKFDYELHGVVVSYNNSDGITDIWHHKRWKDFLNLRDLCVIWGKNVESGVYLNMEFHNDSWTCWAFWPDRSTGSLFSMTDLSNNHLLADNDTVKAALMASEPGDHIRFKGVLAEYANPANGFSRGTSTRREDTGNGACETVYLNEFEIIKKANPKVRRLYTLATWLTVISLIGYAVMFVVAPPRIKS
ncbi:MAG: hypothetical protein ACU85E_05910 [Gammaproteobacteria bacterium]